MSALRMIVVALALIAGSWMAFDGTRALTVGDYVTPKNGPYAGQLGPWHHVVEAVGIGPRSTVMKLTFVVFGVAWLLIAVAFARGASWAPAALLTIAVCSLWYLPVGTACSALVLGGVLWLGRA